MAAAVLSILPRPKGRQSADGKGLLRMFPYGSQGRGRIFIYAIAFEGDVVKVGQTKNPRTRLSTHWRSAKGEVKWIHLFASMHRETATLVESRAQRALCNLGRQINKSEWFFASATKAEVIAVIRPLVDECKREVTARWEQRNEETRRRAAMTRLLIENGFLPAKEKA